MSDREKVIKGLECLARKREPLSNPCSGCGYNDRANFAFCVVDVASDALELLKPVELIDDGPDYLCSGCGEKINGEIVYMVSSVRYCPNCGKAVKWNG